MKFKKAFLVPIVLLTLVSVFLAAKLLPIKLSLPSWPPIESIECKTQYGPCDEKDLARLENLKGKNFFLLKKEDVETLIKENPTNESVHIQKLFPNKLTVSIKRLTAFVGASKEGLSEGYFLIAKNGYVVSYSENTALPKMALSQDFQNPVVGERVGQKEVEGGLLLQLISQAHDIKSARLTPLSLETTLADGKVIYFPLDKDREVLAGALQLIVSQAKMDDKAPKVIDLRYKNPVLQY